MLTGDQVAVEVPTYANVLSAFAGLGLGAAHVPMDEFGPDPDALDRLLGKPEVKAFLDFFLANAQRIVEHPAVNYVALSNDLYEVDMKRLQSGKTGSAMAAANASGESLELAEIFRRY